MDRSAEAASSALAGAGPGEFAGIAESATAGHAALRADVTGPWPPYSFADAQEL